MRARRSGSAEPGRPRPSRRRHRLQGPLQLTHVATQRGEQRVADPLVGDVLDARHGPAEVGQRRPQRGGRVRQPEVHVAVLPERAEQLDLGHRDPGVAEEREPLREVDLLGAVPHDGEHVEMTSVRRGQAHLGDEQPPQLGLPEQVLVEGVTGAVGVTTRLPLAEQGGSLHGVRREQARQPSCHGVPTPAPQLTLLAALAVAEVQAQRPAPRLAGLRVDHLEQRPDQRVRRPRVVLPGAGDLRDDAGRRPELHAGADTVLAALAVTQPVGESLAEPALDAARRHQDELLRERVGQRLAQQPGQAVDELVRARGAVEDQRHLAISPDGPATGPSGCPRRP